jgi:hypothetical protein
MMTVVTIRAVAGIDAGLMFDRWMRVVLVEEEEFCTLREDAKD